jgi:hypothetical protein
VSEGACAFPTYPSNQVPDQLNRKMPTITVSVMRSPEAIDDGGNQHEYAPECTADCEPRAYRLHVAAVKICKAPERYTLGGVFRIQLPPRRFARHLMSPPLKVCTWALVYHFLYTGQYPNVRAETAAVCFDPQGLQESDYEICVPSCHVCGDLRFTLPACLCAS